MNQKSLKLIEFDKILSLLSEQSDSEAGKSACLETEPFTDKEDIESELEKTGAALRLINAKGYFSMRALKSMDEVFSRIKVEAPLNVNELLLCGDLFNLARRLKEYRGRSEEYASPMDADIEYLFANKHLEEKIYNAISHEGEVLDGASEELARIRRSISNAQNKVRESLNKLIHSQKYAQSLQEPVITQRGGRFVVPVKAEYKSEINGMVHDVSSTGATLFIEPAAVVEANNEIRILEGKERKEIERILYELSADIFSYGEALADNYRICVKLDTVFAKAKLAIEMRATVPNINENGILDLKKARHPLLSRDTVVPVSISMAKNCDTIVITGPNTGGKTVTLKIVGLMCAMAQSGMFIPCEDDSALPVFENILADLGDEQSIEQSLSTFSSHMVNIIEITEAVDDKSLCLFDELGAGTDPVEGAALSVAILEYIRKSGAKTVCTTHYPELKIYALETKGVVNASCEFDVATLRPTYRLILGTPGRSNAFAISERLGLSKYIIEDAASRLSSESVAFEEVLQKIEYSRQESEKALIKAKADMEEAHAINKKALEKREGLEKEMQKNYERSKAEAKRTVEIAKTRVNDILNELDELIKQKERADFKEKVGDFRRKAKGAFKELDDEIDPVTDVKIEYELPRALVIGDSVEVVGIARNAVVKSLPDKNGRLTVTAGVMSMQVNVSDLRLIKKPAPEKKKKYGSIGAAAGIKKQAKTELNIIGLNTMEMEPELEKFIDDAYLAGLTTVTVVHGKGTGVLRQAVADYLKGHPHVASYRAGRYGEGETGVTVVEIKQ